MKIVIIIPTFNRKNCLEILLHQLKNQIDDKLAIEIIVVVDGSTDGTEEMLEKGFPDAFIVIGTGNWWYTKSMNEGFKYARKLKPDYVLTLNDDIEIEHNYIKTLIDDFYKINEDCILGSISLTHEKPQLITGVGNRKIIKWRFKSIPYYKFLEP